MVCVHRLNERATGIWYEVTKNEMMRMQRFLFQNAWKHVFYNKYNSIVLLLALLLGILFPMMALNDVNDLLRDASISKQTASSHIAIVEYLMKYKEEKEIHKAVQQGKERGLFEQAGFCVCQAQIIYVGDTSYFGGLSGISEEYLSLSGCELLEGDLFTEDDYKMNAEKVCLLSHQSILVCNGIKVGDTVEILGTQYRVKGIVRVPKVYGGVLIPYATAAEYFSAMNDLLQYQIITYGEEEAKPTQIAYQLFEFEDEGVLVAQNGTEQDIAYNQSIQEVNKYRMGRAAIVIFFAVGNVMFLLIGMLVRERYDMAVRMALGASVRLIWLEMFFRNLLLLMMALVIAICIYPMVVYWVNGSNRYLQGITILQISIGGILLTLLMSGIVYRFGLRKQDVVSLLKK